MSGPVSRRALLTRRPDVAVPVVLIDDQGTPLPLLAHLNANCISIQGTACRLCGDPCDPRAIRFRPLVGGRVLPEISAETCTGCGVCISVCPVGALSMAPVSRV